MMDETQFDTLAEGLWPSGSRRRVLAALGGGALAGLLGRSSARADDALKSTGKKCTKDEQCQSGYCDRDEAAKHGTCQERCTGDCTPPSCSTQIITGPPDQAVTTIQDTGSGLAEILVTQSANADTVVPPFTVGTTEPVVVTAINIDQSQAAVVSLLVTDVAGNETVCSEEF
jgi:hypothetical protein